MQRRTTTVLEELERAAQALQVSWHGFTGASETSPLIVDPALPRCKLQSLCRRAEAGALSVLPALRREPCLAVLMPQESQANATRLLQQGESLRLELGVSLACDPCWDCCRKEFQEFQTAASVSQPRVFSGPGAVSCAHSARVEVSLRRRCLWSTGPVDPPYAAPLCPSCSPCARI